MHSSTKLTVFSYVLTASLVIIQGCAPISASKVCSPIIANENPSAAAMASELSSIKEKYKLSAVIFSAVQNGSPILRTALGTSEPGIAATTGLHFRIGGVGWQFLSAVMLRMAEQNKISLSDKVSKWYPNYPHADQMTLRMLAASSAGLGEYIDVPEFVTALSNDPLRVWTADELIAFSVAPYRTPQFNNPGQDWKYSHTGFVMLGAILEKVSGKSYAELLDEFILKPLELRETRLQLDTNPQLPVLHTLTDDTFQDSTFWNPSFVSWAALTSNICELSEWNTAYGTASFLSSESRTAITSTQNVGLGPFTSTATYYGLGTVVFTPWIFANASYWGMYTATAYDPTTNISLAVTVSLSPDSPGGIKPADEIIAKMSKLLTPDHSIPFSGT